MPGVLTLEELQTQIDLDHWRLVVHNSLVEMNVSVTFPSAPRKC